MVSARAKLGSNGRIVIPAHFRKSLGLSENDNIVMVLEDDAVRLMSVRAAVARAQKLFARCKKPGKSMVGELIAERGREAKREQK